MPGLMIDFEDVRQKSGQRSEEHFGATALIVAPVLLG
jgi:hypothetical protein